MVILTIINIKIMIQFIKQVFFSILVLFIQLVTVSTTYGGCCAFAGFTERTVRNNQNTIERTFKKVAIRNISRSPSNCINPELDISIDSLDMAQLFALGTRRVRWETDTVNSIFIDVGYAVEDTQFWSIPNLNLVTGFPAESIDPALSPFVDSFPGTNVVLKTSNQAGTESIYAHYKLDADDFLQLGFGHDVSPDPYLIDWFETEAFLPIECGWEIEETITTEFAFDPQIDSIIEFKYLTVHSTGMMTPINEEPVPAVLAYLEYDYEEWKDGVIIYTEIYDAFIWFSTEGHRIIGYLADGSPLEGVAEFEFIQYEKNILPCDVNQDIGVDPFAGTYSAQDKIASGASISNGPIQFVAAQEIELKAGFFIDTEFDAIIDIDPCNY